MDDLDAPSSISADPVRDDELPEARRRRDRVESLSVFAGQTAHDLNNYLMAILGNTSLALMSIKETEKSYKHLKQVESAANRAAAFAKDLHLFAGKARLSPKPADLSQFVREMDGVLKGSLGADIEIEYDLAVNLPPSNIDVPAFRRLVMNLALNCSESMDAKGKICLRTGSCEVTQGFDPAIFLQENLPAGTYNFLEIEDCGKGIERADLEHIFDPFFTRKAKGRGLGLAAVFGIVRCHGGAIKVTSTAEKGTVIRILLPAKSAGSPE